MNKKHIGSSFDDFLKEEGIFGRTNKRTGEDNGTKTDKD